MQSNGKRLQKKNILSANLSGDSLIIEKIVFLEIIPY
jgi:hypothetical protein